MPPDRWPPRPSLSHAFYKAHGLGNDYLVFEEGDGWLALPEAVVRVCDPHVGVGSDGIVVILRERVDDAFSLRMFNPDGGEFERSGNGLRVLGSFLARRGVHAPIHVSVGGDRVRLDVHGVYGGVYDVSAAMGRAGIGPDAVAMERSAISVDGDLAGPDGPLRVEPVSVGNPHLVVLDQPFTEERLGVVGRFLVGHAALAHGANVQLARLVEAGRAEALVWERGVGPTSASGTSACAVAVALVRSGRAAPGDIVVSMPGGDLSVRVSAELDVVLRGPVEEVCEGVLAPGVTSSRA